MKRNLITGAMALLLISSTGAFAQVSAPNTKPTDATAKPADTADEPQQKITSTETVTVTASGEDRSEQSIDNKSMIESAPGTSPIEVLSRLPSVEVTGADPYGSYEWAVRISVRGFNQNQLGFTLDDVPLGDMSYGNLNGLHISRALIDENMGHTTLSQGTGGLETASNSNLGGTVAFGSIDPSDTHGLYVTQSFGSFNAYRTYARFESGLLPTHTKFYVSGVYQQADKWKGHGQIGQFYPQFNAKLTQQIGTKGLLTFYYDYSNRHEVDYQDLNKVWDQKLGYDWDNFGNWGTAVQAANAYNAQGGGAFVFPTIPTVFPYPVSTLQSGFGDLSNDPEDAAYYGGGGLRKDNLAYISYKTALSSKLFWKTTVYGHIDEGRGLWFTPYLESYDSSYTPVSPISLRTSEYGIHRLGFVTSLSYETARNKVEGGAWFEDESFNLARRFFATTLESPVYSLYDFPKNPFYTQWAFNFKTTVYQLHLQDQFKITQKLMVSAGFKAIETNTDGELTGFNTGLDLAPTTVASQYAQGSLGSGKPFLPQFGADYKFDGHSEVFGDAAWNVRAYQAGGPGFGNSPWGTNQTGFEYIKTSLKPESAWSEEVGYRYSGSKADAQASYFHVNYANRLLAIQQGPSIAGAESTLDNVGGVTTNGFDASGTVPLSRGFSLYNAVTYSKSTYDSNYDTTSSSGSVNVIPTGGKVTVDSPQFLYKDELEYNYHSFNAHIGADYMGKRYFTYTDDNSVDGRFLADFGTSYTRERLGEFQDLKLQLNIYNLADAKYYSTVGTNGFIASDPTSVSNNTLQVGSPRTITGSFSIKF
jgi:iron complex outermembrane receptor protein